MKLTAKQEKYARELAKGKTQYESFCIAYPLQGQNSKREAIDVNASKLANSTKIVLRVAELQKDALQHVKYDIEAHFNELEQAKEIAMIPRGQYGNVDTSTMLKAIELKGKVKGLYVTKVEQTNYNHDLNPTEESILRLDAKSKGMSWEDYCKAEGISE